MAEYAFDTPTPIELYVENGSGSITVDAADVGTTEVRIAGRNADEVEVRHDGDQVSVVAPKRLLSGSRLDMTIVAPATSGLVVKTGSADLRVAGPVGATRVKSGSGDVVLDRVAGVGVIDTGSGDVLINEAEEEVRFRSGSGDIRVTEARATVAISSGSGDVRLGHAAGAVTVKTGSGDLEVADAEGDVTMSTGSGDTVIRTARRGRINCKGASGDVRIGIPAGTPVWTDVKTVSGSLKSSIEGVGEPEPGADHVELRTVTVSGDVVLTPS